MAGTLTRTASADLAGAELMLTTSAPATPFLVCRAAEMFEAMLLNLEPASVNAGLTLVVSNLEMKMALRPWDAMGAAVVGLATMLITNPAVAVQEHPNLSSAAMVLASHASTIQEYGATFWHGGEQLRKVDSVLVRELFDAAGGGGLEIAEMPSAVPLRGETVVHSPVLRVGRARGRRRLSAQIWVSGRAVEAKVAPSAENDIWQAARLDHPVEMRIQCRWKEAGGRLRIVQPRILSVVSTIRPATGEELLAEFAEHGAGVFTADDFSRILADISGD